ncbi:MAG TPA: vitamin K epoxide reductase family protein [Solirubrobacteraceae bacterium]|nr:vitamin K epoxide reductase family protein [Solirubrobacteraceae bacterium]
MPDAPPAGAVPPGWDHNPTSLSRRALLSLLAAAGLAIALYLTLFQLRAFDTVWDPWFESRKVLELTEPVPDALAGVLAYGAELLLLALGGRDRWRSLPWVCLALGLTLATGGAVSIALIVIQPTVAAAWCTLCLASACLSLSLLALGFGEARAAWQHVRRARTRGVAFGDAFWGRAAAVPLRGGESPEVQAVDVRSGSSLVVAALLLASWLARPRRPAGR